MPPTSDGENVRTVGCTNHNPQGHNPRERIGFACLLVENFFISLEGNKHACLHFDHITFDESTSL